MIYKPNNDEIAMAFTVAKRRNTFNNGGTNIPSGEVASETERLRQHFAACLAEIAVSRMFNVCWTGCGIGAVGLRDVGNRYEVRSVTERGRGLLIRPKDRDAIFILVYVDVEPRVCDVLGWETPFAVRKCGREIGKGTESPCHILADHDLRPIDLLLNESYCQGVL